MWTGNYMAWGSISLFGGFLENENSLETMIVIFENVSPKGSFWLKMKYFEISVLTANSRYLQTELRSDDGDDNENVKKGKRFNNQNNFARASRFFVHFFAVTARLRPENACFHFFERKYTSDEISSLFLSFFLGIQLLGGFTFDKVSVLE